MPPPGMMPPGMPPDGGQGPGGMDLNALLAALMQTEDPVQLAEQSKGEQEQMGMSPMLAALLGMGGEMGMVNNQTTGPGMAPGAGMMPQFPC